MIGRRSRSKENCEINAAYFQPGLKLSALAFAHCQLNQRVLFLQALVKRGYERMRS